MRLDYDGRDFARDFLNEVDRQIRADMRDAPDPDRFQTSSLGVGKTIAVIAAVIFIITLFWNPISTLFGIGTENQSKSSNENNEQSNEDLEQLNLRTLEVPIIEDNILSIASIVTAITENGPVEIERLNASILDENHFNEYTFQAEYKGYYHFGLTNIPVGETCKIALYKYGGSKIESGTYSNGDGLYA